MAYHQDIGVTSEYLPIENYNPFAGGAGGDPIADPEIPAGTVNDVVFYLQTLRPPLRRNADDPVVREGEMLFASIGCGSCHVPSMKTGQSPIAPLSEQEAFLYSDMLLHDMGPTSPTTLQKVRRRRPSGNNTALGLAVENVWWDAVLPP
jgi:CxxC motif-containing protein (DUF1111 family)